MDEVNLMKTENFVPTFVVFQHFFVEWHNHSNATTSSQSTVQHDIV